MDVKHHELMIGRRLTHRSKTDRGMKRDQGCHAKPSLQNLSTQPDHYTTYIVPRASKDLDGEPHCGLTHTHNTSAVADCTVAPSKSPTPPHPVFPPPPPSPTPPRNIMNELRTSPIPASDHCALFRMNPNQQFLTPGRRTFTFVPLTHFRQNWQTRHQTPPSPNQINERKGLGH